MFLKAGIFAVLLLIVGQARATNLRCGASSADASGNIHLAVAGWYQDICADEAGTLYNVTLGGIGPGIQMAKPQLYLKCTSLDQLPLGNTVKMGAICTSISCGLGADGGFAFNLSGNGCTVYGLNVGLGASVKAGKLSIKKCGTESECMRDWGGSTDLE
jgi:hypothetical protein